MLGFECIDDDSRVARSPGVGPEEPVALHGQCQMRLQSRSVWPGQDRGRSRQDFGARSETAARIREGTDGGGRLDSRSLLVVCRGNGQP
jgi:hypothetical protein